MRLLKREVTKQFLKFCLIGLETTLLYYIIFLLLYHFLNIYYLLSTTIAFVIGAFVGFFFNRLLTFNSKYKSVRYLIEYFLVNLTTLGIMNLLLKILVDYIGLNPLISTASIIPITTLINFFSIKIFVFKNKKW